MSRAFPDSVESDMVNRIAATKVARTCHAGDLAWRWPVSRIGEGTYIQEINELLGTGKQVLSSTFTGQIAVRGGLKDGVIENDSPDIVVIQEMYSRLFGVEGDDLELNELIVVCTSLTA